MDTGIYGWRARLGYAGPSPLSETPYDFWRLAPGGVSLVATGLHLGRDGGDAAVLAAEAAKAARALEAFGLDMIAIGAGPLCWDPAGAERKALDAALAGTTTAPRFVTGEAVLAALGALGARRIAMLSPYAPERDAGALAALQAHGIAVHRTAGAPPGPRAEADRLPALAAAAVRQAGAADALYIAGDRWVVEPQLREIERELNVAVVTDTLAMLWHLLRHLHVRPAGDAPGRLLATLRA